MRVIPDTLLNATVTYKGSRDTGTTSSDPFGTDVSESTTSELVSGLDCRFESSETVSTDSGGREETSNPTIYQPAVDALFTNGDLILDTGDIAEVSLTDERYEIRTLNGYKLDQGVEIDHYVVNLVKV
jgi:hypothetical protein